MQDLDIFNILKKLKECNSVISNLFTKRQKRYILYNHQNVISIETENEKISDGSSSETMSSNDEKRFRYLGNKENVKDQHLFAWTKARHFRRKRLRQAIMFPLIKGMPLSRE